MMGLSNFPTAAEGILPVLVMNTVLSVTLLKNMVRSLFQVVDATTTSSNFDIEDSDGYPEEINNARERRISITQFKSLSHDRYSSSCEDSARDCCSRSSSGANMKMSVECCVCLCGLEADEEVSELSCKHFFHKGCLDKWFDNKHTTCPLCRSIH
ncbi:hypothetical protein REPUB_Repub04eG0185300 [Reevesia pubescens]